MSALIAWTLVVQFMLVSDDGHVRKDLGRPLPVWQRYEGEWTSYSGCLGAIARFSDLIRKAEPELGFTLSCEPVAVHIRAPS